MAFWERGVIAQGRLDVHQGAEPLVDLVAGLVAEPLADRVDQHGPGLPGAGRGAVAVEDFGAVGAAGGGGAVGVEGDGPAPLVDGHVVVKEAVQGTAVDAGLAAVGQVGHVVHFAG